MSIEAVTEKDRTVGVTPAAAWRIRTLSVLPDYRLAVTFQDGKRGIVDLSSIRFASNPGVYAPLTDPDYFARATLQTGAITWPNGADLDPFWIWESLADGESWSVPF